jgi:hypothetical protein
MTGTDSGSRWGEWKQRYREGMQRSSFDRGYPERILARRVVGPIVINDLVLLMLGLVFFLLVPFGDLDTINGDNIAQVGYWRVLHNPHLVGSIGVSNPKLGLMLLMGVVNDVSMAIFHSTVLLRPVCALFGAMLTWVVGRIASDIEGPAAGLLAALFLLAFTTLADMFTIGSAMFFSVPLLYGGIWLFSNGREGAGTALLCAAILIRLECVGAIAWLGISNQLMRRNWRGFLISALASIAAVAAVVAAIFVVQGDASRLDAGGASTGYIFTREPSLAVRLQESAAAMWSAAASIVSANGSALLAALALLSLACSRSRRSFASLAGIVFFLMLLQIFGGGIFETRYFEFLIPLLAAFGAAGAVSLVRVVSCFVVWKRFAKARCEAAVALLSAGLAVAGFGALFLSTASASAELRVASYTKDAAHLLVSRPIPSGSSVLIDDNITCGVVIREPHYFRKVTSLQLFNISDDSTRRRMLADADYVLISKRRYNFYYLRYDPLKRGKRDAFRREVRRVTESNKSGVKGLEPIVVYSHTLTPIVNSRHWTIFRVSVAE